MITILDVIDSAVKVGLGALISGAATYFALSKKHAHERKIDLISYKRDKLNEISEKVRLAGELTNNITLWINQEPSDQISKVLLDNLTAAETAKNVCNLVSSAVGLSALIGDQKLRDLMEEYWENRNLLYKFLNRNEMPVSDEYNHLKFKVDQIRLQIFDHFSIAAEQIHA
jgi:hypothetical protein